jgi:putative ABC transport system permease protein
MCEDIHLAQLSNAHDTTSAHRKRSVSAMRDFVQDIRYALRTLATTPAFTALAIVTIALGVGANTAVFSMVNGVLLRRLPYAGDDRLIHIVQPSATRADVAFSVPEINDYRSQVKELAAVSEYHSMPFQLYGRGEPQRVQTGVVSDNFFNMLGVKPLRGRLFLPGEEAVGAPPVVVLSYKYWIEQLGGDPTVVGTHFTMNDHVHTIVGILPPLPVYPDANDIWMPAGACPFRSEPNHMADRNGRMLSAFAVLAPGKTLDQGMAGIRLVNNRLHAEYPASYPAARKLSIGAIPLRTEITSASRPLFLTLLATAAFVLLIAAANFANLTLARQLRRNSEIALRIALGAGRGRIFRQLVTESLCITLAGGVLGLGVAWSGLGLLRSFATRVTPRADEISIDLMVLAFAIAVSVVVGLVAALVPLMRNAPPLSDTLRAGAVTTTGGRADGRMRDILVVVQVAVAFVLLIGAGLMARSLVKLQRVDGGYQTAGILTGRIDLNWTRYTSTALVTEFAQGLTSRLAGQPGVLSVALSSDFPLNNGRPSSQPFLIKGLEPRENDAGPQSDVTVVSGDYFKTIGVPLVRGRLFTDADRDTSNVPAVIGQRLAATHWAGKDPIGQQVSINRGRSWQTIVGVVGDVKQGGLQHDITDEIYLPYSVLPTGDIRVLVRTQGDPMAMAPKLRAAVKDLDDKQPLVQVQTLEQLRGQRLSEPRVTTALLVAFAILAMVITAAGLGGVVAYGVNQRLNEIGIRVALGAKPMNVLSLVVRHGMSIVAVGLAIGVAGALGTTRLIGGLLYAVGPNDVVTYVGVAAALLAVAGLASYLPARRALKVDPVQALRAR